MSARFRRIGHQQAQVSSFETFYSKPESLTIVLLSKYIEQQLSYPWYSPNFCCKMLSLSDLVTAKLPQSRSSVARCIPVFPSRYIRKCATRVLKRSGLTDWLAVRIVNLVSSFLNPATRLGLF